MIVLLKLLFGCSVFSLLAGFMALIFEGNSRLGEPRQQLELAEGASVALGLISMVLVAISLVAFVAIIF